MCCKVCGLSALSFEVCPKWEIGLHTTKISNDSFYIRPRVVYYYTMVAILYILMFRGMQLRMYLLCQKKGI